jgi:hypothetical protein
MGLRGWLLCVVATATAAITIAAPVLGAELTRAEYVERAETICEFGSGKAKPLLRKGFAEFKANEVKSAGPKFLRAAKYYAASRDRLTAVPMPVEDKLDLLAWQKQLKVQNFFLGRTGQALVEERRVKAQGYLSRFIHNGNVANDLVLGFGFKTCLFDSHMNKA